MLIDKYGDERTSPKSRGKRRKMNKRETALEIIRTEYVKYGKSTLRSIRAFIENRISKKAYDDAVWSGMLTFNARRDGGKGQ